MSKLLKILIISSLITSCASLTSNEEGESSTIDSIINSLDIFNRVLCIFSTSEDCAMEEGEETAEEEEQV